MIRCYVFDLDGTLADCSHRLHHIHGRLTKDWRAFFAAVGDDVPIPHIIELAKKLRASTPIMFVSGRSDECREATMEWLERQGFSVHRLPNPRMRAEKWNLYMRAAGDHRPDHVVKAELLAEMRADGFEPIMAFDDRDQVVAMWRKMGIPCAQVAEGGF